MRQFLESITPCKGIPGSLQSNWARWRQAWEHRKQAWEHLGAPATNLGALATNLGALATNLGVPATCLGAPRITVEQFGKNIFFENAAGAPGNHSYYLLFNDVKNSYIQFVFSSMYLCVYVATHLHTVYLDWLHAVLKSNSRRA